MKTLLPLLLIIILSNITIAQSTAIPDANFEQALIDLGLDIGVPNGVVPTSNIDTVTTLDVSFKQISNLTGIENFTALDLLQCGPNNITNLNISQNTALTVLQCNGNQLTSLDLTQNIALEYLRCDGNQLTSLNVTQNPALIFLMIGDHSPDNQISSIDLSQNIALEHFTCNNNLLTRLDLSQNPALTSLSCESNNLTCINLKNGNNSIITNIYAHGNHPNFTCIEVDDTTYSTINWRLDSNGVNIGFSFDISSSFSSNCGPCTVGVNDLEQNFSNLNLYPNPTTGKITIDLGEIKQGIKATMTNGLGQVILTKQFESTDNINIDIVAPIGIYFLQLKTADGETKTLKVLKE